MCTVLFVCQGNQCRSPLAQALFIAAIPRCRGTRWRVESAGTHAEDGRPVVDGCGEHLHDPRVDLSRFRSRRLTTAMVDDAQAIITMTREQAATVLRRQPRALRRTATLAELARCAERSDRELFTRGGDALLELLRLTIRDRGPRRPRHAADDDIPDPVRDLATLLPGTEATIAAAIEQIALVVNPVAGRAVRQAG
ncbi:arsenate reductase/protein-tyrosine-phosphatase family protein [Actinokineospora bangkokensis]|uniref:protein-tyrosine-phosphatase n=1 Tax=Actinokineospora bangkokensis TaxID=1193682 RepID=A0A1Q9LJW9_9PSEU|nr:hypothetical protein [Actinokineospora bangkokensis]OLR92279.1 hypothetical protein BJP25_23485 [Actinokineospora bangkokensis]